MSEAVREMTYDEQIVSFIKYILAMEVPFGVKRDLIGRLLSLTYRHERDIKEALYTPTPSCTLDSAPVVRCRECKWFGSSGCAIKIVDESDKPNEYDYCAFGERKVDE